MERIWVVVEWGQFVRAFANRKDAVALADSRTSYTIREDWLY